MLSRGTYIAFCDADDIWKKNKLNLQIKFMKKYNLNFSHTSYFVIDKKEKKIGKFKTKSKIEYQDLLKSCDIGLSTVIVKKNLLRKKIYFATYKQKKIFIYGFKLLKRKKKYFQLINIFHIGDI